MIVRAFRVTDRLGNALLRISAWLTSASIQQASALKRGLFNVLATVWKTALGLLLLGYRAVVGTARTTQQAVEATQQVVETTAQRRQERMAQRAAEAELKPTVAPDPLLAQNRALSAFAVLLLLALLAVVVVQTSDDDDPTIPAGVVGQWPQAQGTTPPTAVFPTPLPTPTPVPDPLRVGGSLVYSLRENGQQDLWVVSVGESTPLRLTNHPADDRDPAWSPDGTRVAFSSNRDGNWELYILRIDTGALLRLTYSQGFEGAPTWSPDGAWLAYEGYYPNSEDLDIYIISTDPVRAAQEGAQRLTYTPGPDIEPDWSPELGREIAFTSWRSGNPDIYQVSLGEGGGDAAAINLTNSPDTENHPDWSPDGTSLAFSATVNGVQGVYVKPAAEPAVDATLTGRGTMPAWAPNGGSLIYTLDVGRRTQLITGVPGGFGASADAVTLPARATDPDWAAPSLPRHFIDSGGLPPHETIIQPLYTEAERLQATGLYGLAPLNNVQAPQALLSDRVNDSFEALRLRVLEKTGYDFLGTLEDAFWHQDRPPEPGEPERNWHYTGRAFAIARDAVYDDPPAPIEVVREDVEINTYWRVFVRVTDQAQDGTFGEPLRVLPWDFESRVSGDVEDYERGGKTKSTVPTGYYVDLTQIAADYGWQRLPALPTWQYNFGAIQFWEFVKPDGLTWEEAMREIYTAEQFDGFLNPATSVPPPPPLPTASPTPAVQRSPTPIPPDQLE